MVALGTMAALPSRHLSDVERLHQPGHVGQAGLEGDWRRRERFHET